MAYNLYQGVVNERKNQLGLLSMAIGFAVATTMAFFSQANAASTPVVYTSVEFTPAEVATWSPDRTAPTGGWESTAFGTRTNVLEMNLLGEAQSDIPHHQTEGLQKDIDDSDSIKADLYVDTASWGDETVRAGIWGVAHDSTGDISAYPILEYSTDGTDGWRYWDVNKWVPLTDVEVLENAWNTLAITHDSANNSFVFYVNGVQVATADDSGSETIAAAILNSKNYGENYSVNWSKFAYGNVVTPVTTKEACKNNGWATSFDKNGNTFKNQGQCVSSVASNKNAN